MPSLQPHHLIDALPRFVRQQRRHRRVTIESQATSLRHTRPPSERVQCARRNAHGSRFARSGYMHWHAQQVGVWRAQCPPRW